MSSSHTEQAAGTSVVQMPQMGVSVSEGTIVEWRKRPGDWVEADETLCEVTTDKVDVEIPAPASGRLAVVIAGPGTTVAVGEPIAEIDTAARPGEAHPQEAPASAPGAGSASTKAGGEAQDAEIDDGADRSRFYSPVVRRIADKHGVDLDAVAGTGVGGRVRKRDVLAYVEGNGEAANAEPVLHMESPYRPDEPAAPEAPAAAPDGAAQPTPAVAGERREPMGTMRAAIARHMLESRRTSAHCTTMVEVDMSAVLARREQLRDDFERRGARLTPLAFVAEAAVAALGEHPILNASIEGEEVVYHDDVNLGIAVALEPGLIVPVIDRAQRLSLEGLAAAIADVAERARSKRLDPDEVHGGTFTITNPGRFGALLATPIINQPQVAILDLEAIVKRPVVFQTPRLLDSAPASEATGEGLDSIAIRSMSHLCMSWDHRALDGIEAARFLGRIKQTLESLEMSG